jgi:hypothetical protein
VEQDAETKAADERERQALEQFVAFWLERRIRWLTVATEARRRCDELMALKSNKALATLQGQQARLAAMSRKGIK